MFSEIESAIKLWGRFSQRFLTKKKQESVATRFVRLFEAHGVHRNQIPRFFGQGITVADIKDDETLLPKLTENVLDVAVKLFAVRREWLDGADAQIYPLHDFYKHPEEFEQFLSEIQSANPEQALRGILFAPDEAKDQAEALIILEESIGWVGDKQINRFHICYNWYFSYWKARAYLTACVAIAWRRSVYLLGRIVPAKSIAAIATGNIFLELDEDGLNFIGGKHWYPEDMALEPNAFLERIDPERENFGIKSALKLWLDLHDQEHMNTNIPSDGSPRGKFEEALRKL